MSVQDELLRSPEPAPALDRKPSPASSDRDTDTFEDAVDTGSIRSLTTKRLTSSSAISPRPDSSIASPRPDTPDTPGPGALDSALDGAVSPPTGTEAPSVSNDDKGAGDDSDAPPEPVEPSSPAPNAAEDAEDAPEPASAHHSKTPSLDNVDLDDAAAATAAATATPIITSQPVATTKNAADVSPPPEKGPEKGPSKKLSLSNITSSLPAMPWSPAPTESPPKTSPNPNNTASAGTGATAAATGAAAAAPPPPATTSRKFTSPFSWMSRNSSHKEQPATSPPVTASNSPRRNTASSIATLTSNPEMMLSKLDEENETGTSNTKNRSARSSLKDRFKMVRMREEAGISMSSMDDDKDAQAAPPTRSSGLTTTSNPSEAPETPDGSAVPAGHNPELAPGTVSGVSAGPSALGDTQVDWDLWQSVVYEGPSAVARTSAEELNRAIATGIPNVIRGVVWQVLAQSKNDDLELVYHELANRGTEKDKDRNSNGTSASSSSNGNLSVENKEALASSASSIHSEHSGASGLRSPLPESSEAAQKASATAKAERKKKEKEDAAALQKLEKVIKRDLGARTSFSKHAASAGLQDGLFGVCKAYALFDEGVGYAQGMNFLIMPLLFNMPEEEAFCILVRLMNKYKLRDLFIQNMPGLHLSLYQFERLLEDLEPALYCHLHRRGISSHLYATQWFLTLFAYRFPLQLVLRIYDLIFSEGLSAIIKFGIVLMQKNASTLLGMSDMAQLTTFLKDKVFDVYIDQSPSAGSILESGFFGSSSSAIEKEVYRADQLVRDACEVKVTPELLQAYTEEWEEKTRQEKEREEELQNLRTTNSSSAVKLRKLEERLEASDRESADMATDLVQTKVQNEELKDKNESLEGQVKELRHVIEKQPEEIESAWRPERDSLMERNEKVHQENQRLEKEMADLEEQLVQTKMQYAEINQQHEALQRKWQDLKKQFSL